MKTEDPFGDAVDRAWDEIRYQEHRRHVTGIMFLFATIDRQGTVEFHEVPSREFETFKESLRVSEYVDFDWDVLRERELRIRKAEMTSRLQKSWLERRKNG